MIRFASVIFLCFSFHLTLIFFIPTKLFQQILFVVSFRQIEEAKIENGLNIRVDSSAALSLKVICKWTSGHDIKLRFFSHHFLVSFSTYNDVNLSIKTAPDAIVAQFCPAKIYDYVGNFYHDNNLILCSFLASVCTVVCEWETELFMCSARLNLFTFLITCTLNSSVFSKEKLFMSLYQLGLAWFGVWMQACNINSIKMQILSRNILTWNVCNGFHALNLGRSTFFSLSISLSLTLALSVLPSDCGRLLFLRANSCANYLSQHSPPQIFIPQHPNGKHKGW